MKSQWLQGHESGAGHTGVSAFAVLDDLLAYLADRHRFPHLQDITLIGHSAGGQLLQRYTLLGTGDQALRTLGIHVRYIVASPSTYLYLDANRPLGEGFALYLPRSAPTTTVTAMACRAHQATSPHNIWMPARCSTATPHAT